MRRTTLASFLPAALLLSAASVAAQTKHPKPGPHPSETDHTPATTTLPVTRVSLYKNGVGFFEHTGHISGNAAVTIDFTSGQLNDVLQSLTAIDLNGGRIAGADYNSTTPLDQQLKNLPLALGEETTSMDFYNAIRGSRVEVHSGSVSITGRLLSVDAQVVDDDSAGHEHIALERHFLTVVSDSGESRSIEITPATSVRLLDTALHTDVNRYLQLIDANRSQGLRHLTLTDNGTGSRELRLSYISEVPVWKSTYRILFTTNSSGGPSQVSGGPSQVSGGPSPVSGGPSFASSAKGGVGTTATASSDTTATIQGWSVVDNTTGADWINVQLSLIAGAPQSFIQPLSQPIYSRRPEIPIAQEAQLTPQTFDSSIDNNGAVAPAPMMAMGGSSPRAAKVMMGNGAPAGVSLHGSSGYAATTVTVADAADAISYESAAETSLNPATTSAAFDDFFAYNLTEPVTILKNQSALVPILQTKVAADPVTVVSYRDPWSVSQPLRAMWITNSSGLTLDRGSFSILEDGNFAGEGILDAIHPNERRLLSYAADQAIHVTSTDIPSGHHIISISAARGVLHIQNALTEAQTYTIHNAAPEPRTVVLEYPVNSMFTLDASTPPPTETTPTVYRFRVAVAPGATVTLPVAKHGDQTNNWQLTTTDENQFKLIFSQSDNNPQLIAALQPILDARRKVSDSQTAINQTSKRLTDLRADEDRQRANITALASADKSSRDRFVRDLNSTEDSITNAQKELAARTAALEAAKADLANRIDSFQIDTR